MQHWIMKLSIVVLAMVFCGASMAAVFVSFETGDVDHDVAILGVGKTQDAVLPEEAVATLGSNKQAGLEYAKAPVFIFVKYNNQIHAVNIWTNSGAATPVTVRKIRLYFTAAGDALRVAPYFLLGKTELAESKDGS